jgi:uncharacterized membrane protein YeaQ/YmgE (transglycosylase-associated protein family)
MNFLFAVLIGAIIGAGGWLAIRNYQRNAIWLAPLLGIGGAVLASVAAALFGDSPVYGPWEAILQVVLAVVAVGALAVPVLRRASAVETAGK